jgi:hypothetical protein
MVVVPFSWQRLPIVIIHVAVASKIQYLTFNVLAFKDSKIVIVRAYDDLSMNAQPVRH